MIIKRAFVLLHLLMLATPMPASASVGDCTKLYVVRLYFSMADPRPQVSFAESATAASGTPLVYPASGLTDRAYQQLYAALLTAKSAGRTVTVTTDGPNQCVLTGAQYLTAIELD